MSICLKLIEVDEAWRRLEILFPMILEYEAEDEVKELLVHGPDDDRRSRRRACTLKAGRTVFRDGTAVLHLVFNPDLADPERGALNEWDVLKLVKLWEGGEAIDDPDSPSYLRRCLRFSTRDGSVTRTIDALAQDIFQTSTTLTPRMGTVQLLTEDEESDTDWDTFFSSVSDLAVGKPGNPALEGQIKAVAGLLQGVLDFPYVDTAELEDVFKPIRVLEDSLIGVHKGTMLQLSLDDRPFRSAVTKIGISPYLILPHAVLLYNHYQLEHAGEEARSVDDHNIPGDQLESAARAMRLALLGKFLPNVFHYPLETYLYDSGMESRRARDLKESLERTLAEVDSRLKLQREEHQKHLETGLLVFGLIFAGLQLVLVFDTVNRWTGWFPLMKP